jgi:salicylate 5-hydroxylase small subunit
MSASTDLLKLEAQINRFNAQYAAALDARRFTDWPNFFTADARYQVQGRENFDRNLPLCLIDLESQAMMQDRVYGISQTIYHAPYYTRHIIGAALVMEADAGSCKAESNFAVIRTKPGASGGGVSEAYASGRYVDEFEIQPDSSLLFKRRICVLDSENILNSLIYPI